MDKYILNIAAIMAVGIVLFPNRTLVHGMKVTPTVTSHPGFIRTDISTLIDVYTSLERIHVPGRSVPPPIKLRTRDLKYGSEVVGQQIKFTNELLTAATRLYSSASVGYEETFPVNLKKGLYSGPSRNYAGNSMKGLDNTDVALSIDLPIFFHEERDGRKLRRDVGYRIQNSSVDSSCRPLNLSDIEGAHKIHTRSIGKAIAAEIGWGLVGKAASKATDLFLQRGTTDKLAKEQTLHIQSMLKFTPSIQDVQPGLTQEETRILNVLSFQFGHTSNTERFTNWHSFTPFEKQLLTSMIQLTEITYQEWNSMTIANHLSGIRICLSNRIPKNIISHQQLYEFLTALESNLPPEVFLTIQAKDVGRYFDEPLAKCMFEDNGYMIEIKIPIIANIGIDYSELVTVNSLPFRTEAGDMCRLDLPSSLFIVNNINRNITPAIIDNCISPGLCSIRLGGTPITRKSISCLRKLLHENILHKDDATDCTVICERRNAPYVYYLDDEKTVFVANCDETIYIKSANGSAFGVTVGGVGAVLIVLPCNWTARISGSVTVTANALTCKDSKFLIKVVVPNFFLTPSNTLVYQQLVAGGVYNDEMNASPSGSTTPEQFDMENEIIYEYRKPTETNLFAFLAAEGLKVSYFQIFTWFITISLIICQIVRSHRAYREFSKWAHFIEITSPILQAQAKP